MKRVLLATALFAISATAAHSDNLAGYYGNTVSVTTPDGKVSKSHVNADKTYVTKNPDGTTSKGTWAWQDAKIACFTQTDPAPAAGAKPLCLPVDPHKAGDNWSSKDDKGAETKYSLTAGH